MDERPEKEGLSPEKEGLGPEKEGLSPEELAEQEGEVLPDREVMSVLDANVAIPLDPAIAADVLADDDPGAAGEPEPAGDEEDG